MNESLNEIINWVADLDKWKLRIVSLLTLQIAVIVVKAADDQGWPKVWDFFGYFSVVSDLNCSSKQERCLISMGRLKFQTFKTLDLREFVLNFKEVSKNAQSSKIAKYLFKSPI